MSEVRLHYPQWYAAKAPESGSVESYEVCLFPISDHSCKIVKKVQASSYMHQHFTSLAPQTTYEACVFALSSSGFKSMAKIKQSTAAVPLSSPQQLEVMTLHRSPNSFGVKWKKPASGHVSS